MDAIGEMNIEAILEEGLDSQATKESQNCEADSISEHSVSGNVVRWSNLDQLYAEGKKDIAELKGKSKRKNKHTSRTIDEYN